MATPSQATDRVRRLRAIAEAAAVLDASERGAFLDRLIDIDPAFHAEVEALSAAREALGGSQQERHDVGRLFELLLALHPDDRGAFTEAIRPGTPDFARDLESLGKHAGNREFLERSSWTTDALPDPRIGQRIGAYHVHDKLGEGGMGVVYLAVDTKLERRVALKAVRPEYARDPEFRVRLLHEARSAAAIPPHPGVAAVFALHEEGADLFIVSEFIEGPTLRQVLHQGPMPYARVVRIFTEVAKGLAAAHARGIVHRDLKPENIMLAEGDQPKIVDFGLAKSSDAINRSTTLVTHPSGRPGTPAYMAPEQIEGKAVDFRADQFALGTTLYECLAGVNPFEGATLASTHNNILHRDPPKLAKSGVDLQALGVIVERCLRKAPGERYEKTTDLVKALEEVGFTPPAPPLPAPFPTPHPLKPALWWWRLHQVNVSILQSAALIWLWFAHKLVTPIGLGRLLFLLLLVPTVAAVVLRLLLWFGSFEPASREFARLRSQLPPWVRAADFVFVVTLAVMAGRFLWQDRPGTATPMLIAALVYLITLLAIEPFTNERAFGTYTCPSHPGRRRHAPGRCPTCGTALVREIDRDE